MTDQQTHEASDQPIEEAYARLATAPRAATGRRRHASSAAVGARRRARRRTASSGAAGPRWRPAWSAVPCCSGAATTRTATPSPSDDPEAAGSFVLTRPDGSTYELTDLILSCDGPFGQAERRARTGPQRIWLTSPFPLRCRRTDGTGAAVPRVRGHRRARSTVARSGCRSTPTTGAPTAGPSCCSPSTPRSRRPSHGRTRSPAPRRARPVPSWSRVPAATRCPCWSSRSTRRWAARSSRAPCA